MKIVSFSINKVYQKRILELLEAKKHASRSELIRMALRLQFIREIQKIVPKSRVIDLGNEIHVPYGSEYKKYRILRRLE